MPKFPCSECGRSYPNNFLASRCRLSEECISQQVPEKQVSSANRPPYEFDFTSAKAGDVLTERKWLDFGVDGAHHAMGGLGSLGVFLINLKNDGGVIVVKQGSVASASEFFCSLLYKKIGIETPQMRVLPKGEWLKLVELLGDVSFTSPGAGDHLQSRGIQRGAVAMEFAPGFTLKDPKVAHILKDPKTSVHFLKQFGNIIAVDMLVNNYDRTPAVWPHEGNANNILISVNDAGEVSVKAIDQACSRIKDDPGEDKNVAGYLNKVKFALHEAIEGNQQGEAISKVRKFIETWTGHDIGLVGCGHIQQGMLMAADKIASMEYASLYEQTQDAFDKAQAAWGTPGMESVDLHFLNRVSEIFAEAAARK